MLAFFAGLIVGGGLVAWFCHSYLHSRIGELEDGMHDRFAQLEDQIAMRLHPVSAPAAGAPALVSSSATPPPATSQ